MTEITALPAKPLEAVECAAGVALVRPDGTIVEWLIVEDDEKEDDL